MSQSKPKSFTSIVIGSLGWPLFWGLAATFGFYLMISWGVIGSQLVKRYFAGHPVEYFETFLFFVGVMALIMKAWNLASQFKAMPDTKLPVADEAGDSIDRAEELMDSIKRKPEHVRETYYGRRLTNALRFVARSESAEALDEQLRYLSDTDAERSHEGYSLVRIIVWATPMLGFLGTVIGITLALGQLSPEALVNAPKEAMQGLLAGLSVAFDTTALALSLSIVLMFFQYLVREVETQLLTVVDRRTEDELIGRFQMSGASSDPNVTVIRRMSEKVLEGVEQMAQRQAGILQQSIDASQQQWVDALQNTNTAVQSDMQEAIRLSMMSHAQALSEAEEKVSVRSLERWENIQQSMIHQSSVMAAHYDKVQQQGQMMERVLGAIGEVTTLEKSLNQNLSALASSKNFEDTVMSLSAAIQLLTSRLGVASPGVKLTSEAQRVDAAGSPANTVSQTPTSIEGEEKGRAA